MTRKPAKPAAAPAPSLTDPERAYRGECDLWLKMFGYDAVHLDLPLPRIKEIESRAGAGIGAVMAEIFRGRVPMLDGSSLGAPDRSIVSASLIRTVLLNALIGGGEAIEAGELVKITPDRAAELCEAYLPPNGPLEPAWAYAAAILHAIWHGRDPKPPTPGERANAELLGRMMAQKAEREAAALAGVR